LAGSVAIAILLIGCSSSSKSGTVTSDSGPGGQPAGTLVFGLDGSSSTAEAPSGGEASSTQTAPDGGNQAASASTLDSTGPPGSYAPAYLTAAQSRELVVEVRTQSGTGPQQSTIDHLTTVLSRVSGKPVTVTGGSAIGGGARSWSPDDVRATGSAGAAQGDGRAVIHLLFVHGSLAGDESVLGAAVQGDTAAIFTDQVQSSSTPLVGYAGIESAVVAHEVGHLLGLVDLYLHDGRQDPQHPGHSTNKSSVMYWAVESNVVADLLQGGPPKDFDDADVADLATIRNGG
jgi:hypothetical protein